VEWQRCHGGGYAEFAVDILQEPNGGYTFLGTTYSNDGDVSGNHSAGQDFWLVKLDSVGNLLWQKCYGGNNGEYASRLIRTAWGGYVMMGSSNSYPSGDVGNHHGDVFNSDAWVAVVDSAGNLLAEHSFGGTNDELGINVLHETNEQDLLIGMTTYSTDGDVQVNIHGFNDLWLLKVDTSLNIIWQKSKGGNVGEGAGEAYESNGYYFFSAGTGSTDGFFSANHGVSDVWFLITDTAGNTVEQFLYGGSMAESGESIDTLRGSIFLAANTESADGDVSNNYGESDYWLLVVDTLGNLLDEMNYGGSGKDRFDFGRAILLNDRLLLMGYSESDDFDVADDFNGAGGSWIIALDLLNAVDDPSLSMSGVQVSPNPFSENATVTLPPSWSNQRTIAELFDLQGRKWLGYTSNGSDIVIERKRLKPGLYLLQLTSQESSITLKIVIQ
jgi:hypothetical protein